jgi:hypothetical protein
MWRALALTLLVAILPAGGCAAPEPEWDPAVPTIRPLGPIRAPQGLLIVRTFEAGVADGDSPATRHRGFRVLDRDGHPVHRSRDFEEDWGSVRLFPGPYMVLTFVGDGLCDRHWEKAQVEIEAGKITAVDFVSPGPREILP